VALCVAGPEGSDPTLRPPVSERRVLVVELNEEHGPSPSPPARTSVPSRQDVVSGEQRRLVFALLGLAAGLLLLLLLIVVVFS
jgi:hypothetical protein